MFCVGPKLSEEINEGSLLMFMGMEIQVKFFRAAEENKIINIVNKFKSNTSTEQREFDMTIVKDVTDGIAKALTHILPKTFQIGKFPNEIKSYLIKTGGSHHFTNYGPFSFFPNSLTEWINSLLKGLTLLLKSTTC